MKKNNFATLSIDDLQSINGGQYAPIIIHTKGMLSSAQMQEIRSHYPPNTIIEFVY